MTQDNRTLVAQFWNDSATEFDAIYTGANKSWFSRLLDRYFRRDMYQRFDWVMGACGDLRGRTICDVGCGSGRFVAEFAKRGSYQVTGVDVAPEMIRLAEALVRETGMGDRCDFALGDVLHWKPNRAFDIAIAIGFWDYIEDPAERLRRIHAFTSQTFLSAWPRFWTWRMPVRKFRLQYLRGCPVYFYRKRQVYELLDAAGFEVVSCERVGKLYCVEARLRQPDVCNLTRRVGPNTHDAVVSVAKSVT
jgi:SAM-dependent methyltransferase